MPANSNELVVALLTPNGRGAVATVAIRGACAASLVQQFFLFRRSAAGEPQPLVPARIQFGHWRRSAAESEEVVVCQVAPDVVEVHCHGGEAASRAICGDLVSRGARQISWERWLANQAGAYLGEIRAALAHAVSQRTAAILLDQARGAFETRLREVQAWLATGQEPSALQAVRRLQALIPVGLHLTRPWIVALVGPPNVGKSSLLNALVGFQRSLVFDQPGTTRDVVASLTVVRGWPLELCDTAGLRDSLDPVEHEGTRRAVVRAQDADLVVVVAEPVRPHWDVAAWLRPDAPSRPVLRVLNKLDLVAEAPACDADVMLTSAATGAGVAALAETIVARLVPDEPAPGEAVPVLARHAAAIAELADALEPGGSSPAREVLERLLTDLHS